MGKKSWKSPFNEYWADADIAPIECIGKITCRHLNRAEFRDIVKKAKKVGVYYNHDKDSEGFWVLEIATASKQHTQLLINTLKTQAKMQGVKLNNL